MHRQLSFLLVGLVVFCVDSRHVVSLLSALGRVGDADLGVADTQPAHEGNVVGGDQREDPPVLVFGDEHRLQIIIGLATIETLEVPLTLLAPTKSS